MGSRVLAPLLAAAALLACAVPAAAKTCLVLGGGGARGAAHIGVLKVLERERVPVDCIAGTSMGAAVGGLYAAGYTADEIEALLGAVDWRDVFRDDPDRREFTVRRKEEDLALLVDFDFGLRDGALIAPRGAIQGQKMLLLLRRLTLPVWNVEDFDALPIPFRAVAAKIASGEPRVFAGGDLATAIRASMSVPGALAPIRVDGEMLVDGGIVDQVPVGVARAMGATRLIVVDVSAELLPESELTSPLAITNQMLDALMTRQTRAQLATLVDGDVLLEPELGDIGSTAFHRLDDAIPIGIAAAEARLDALRALSLDESAWAAHVAARGRPAFDAPLVAFLETRAQRSRTAPLVASRMTQRPGTRLDVDTLERDVQRAYGEGSYERITWRLEDQDGETGLIVEPVDKGWGPNFVRFGLTLSDDFAGDNDYLLQAQVRFTGFNAAGAEWRNRVSLGRIAGLRTEYYQPFGELGQYFAEAYGEYRALDQPVFQQDVDLAEYRLRRGVVGFDAGIEGIRATRWLAGIERGRDRLERRIGDPSLPLRLDADYGDVYLGVTRDTLDNAAFPAAGGRFDARVSLYRDVLGADVDAEVLRVDWDRAFARDPHRFLLGVRLNYTEDDDAGLLQANGLLGGFLNLSGYGERALVGDQLGFVRGVYYRRVGDASALFSQPIYVGGSLEAGNTWTDRDDAGFEGLITAGSVFLGLESFLGPMFLGYGRADTGEGSFYLTFGSLIRVER